MEPVPLVGDESPITWAGTVCGSLEVHADGGVQPWRLQHTDAPLYEGLHNGSAQVLNRAATAAGVRLTLMTTAEALELALCWRGPLEQSENMKVDLCLGNELVQTLPIGAIGVGDDAWSQPTTLRFTLPNAGQQQRVELWLPQQGRSKVLSLAAPATAQVSKAVDDRPRWITYGSSITHCGAAHSPSRTWPATCARTADVNLTCLGFGGSCNLDPLVARAIRDAPADAINMKLGMCAPIPPEPWYEYAPS